MRLLSGEKSAQLTREAPVSVAGKGRGIGRETAPCVARYLEC